MRILFKILLLLVYHTNTRKPKCSLQAYIRIRIINTLLYVRNSFVEPITRSVTLTVRWIRINFLGRIASVRAWASSATHYSRQLSSFASCLQSNCTRVYQFSNIRVTFKCLFLFYFFSLLNYCWAINIVMVASSLTHPAAFFFIRTHGQAVYSPNSCSLKKSDVVWLRYLD